MEHGARAMVDGWDRARRAGDSRIEQRLRVDARWAVDARGVSRVACSEPEEVSWSLTGRTGAHARVWF